jgi:hypothetical protein
MLVHVEGVLPYRAANKETDESNRITALGHLVRKEAYFCQVLEYNSGKAELEVI